MRFISLLMLLTSCAGHHTCISNCGIWLESNKYWTCEELQDIEDRSMKAFQETLDPRLYSCRYANGYTLKQVDARSYIGNGGDPVSGETFCDHGIVVIGNARPRESSFTHELVHVLQRCIPTEPYAGEVDSQEYYHSNWDRDKINEAIENASR